jgi:hypothetical protein
MRSVFRRVEFVNDRMLCIRVRGCCCDDIVLNMHAPTEDKSGDIKVGFYEEIECIFDQFQKYHMKILFGEFSARVGRVDICSESVAEIDNGVRVVNIAT